MQQRLNRPHETSAAVYRITIKDEEDPGSAFAQDSRQQVRKVKGTSLELHVKAERGPGQGKGSDEIGPEFLQSSYFINSADATVKELARQAVGKENDPWKKALRIEKWVHERMKGSNHEALAPAEKTIEWGKKIIDYRAETTAKVIRKATGK